MEDDPLARLDKIAPLFEKGWRKLHPVSTADREFIKQSFARKAELVKQFSAEEQKRQEERQKAKSQDNNSQSHGHSH